MRAATPLEILAHRIVRSVAFIAVPMPPTRVVGFALVWLALAVFTVDGLIRRRRAGGSVSAALPRHLDSSDRSAAWQEETE